MANTWLTGPPSAAQVAAHAKKYPDIYGGGTWLVVHSGKRIATLRSLWICLSGRMGGHESQAADASYSPVTAEGLPVDYAALQQVADAAARHMKAWEIGDDSLEMGTRQDLRSALKELEEARRG